MVKPQTRQGQMSGVWVFWYATLHINLDLLSVWLLPTARYTELRDHITRSERSCWKPNDERSP